MPRSLALRTMWWRDNSFLANLAAYSVDVRRMTRRDNRARKRARALREEGAGEIIVTCHYL